MHRGWEGGDLAFWWVKVDGFCTEWDFLLSWLASIPSSKVRRGVKLLLPGS